MILERYIHVSADKILLVQSNTSVFTSHHVFQMTVSIRSGLRTLLHRRRAVAACALTIWQHFLAWSDVMAAILKLRRRIQKSDSVNQCVFTWRTLPTNFILIRFETTEPSAFSKRSRKQEQQEDDDGDDKKRLTMHQRIVAPTVNCKWECASLKVKWQ